ncbi:hypothetical protein [Arthrobacter sp. 35W]|uniref:hypothetical protein n=1 Tax=Arthrobacter sp. 35W TaxID=1132441 RepID=UPI0004230251|nr:hypothetical protein [Arthrobacter sp. 35W]
MNFLPEWVLWIQALAPAAASMAALVAGSLAWATYSQRRTADRRDQWWKRAQWAIDASMDAEDNERQVVGAAILVHLAESDLCMADDRALLLQVLVSARDAVLDTEDANGETGEEGGGDDGEPSEDEAQAG